MKFVIKNVARVSSAEVDLDGITVLAGANGAGKSTVSRSLMTISSVTRRISSLILVERGTSVLSALQDAFRKVGGEIFAPASLLEWQKNSFIQFLSAEWWNDESGVVSWLKAHSAQDLYVFPENFLESEQCLDAIKVAKPKIIEALNRSDNAYVTHICRRAFKNAFNDQIAPVFGGAVESLISVEDSGGLESAVSVSFKDGGLSEHLGIGRTFYPSVVYFEPLSYVDFVNDARRLIADRYSAGGLCICEVVKREPPKNLSFEEQGELDEAIGIVREVVESIHGHLVDDNSDVKFRERFSDGDHLVDVRNIASGMKTMAAIVRAVENRSVRRGSLLIIDEPESNLHPQWQVEFASFLVFMAKRLGISVLLNTHSPYFLRAITVYSKAQGVLNRCYCMTNDGNGDSYHTEDVSNNIERIYSEMAKPFHDLMAQ